MGRSYSEPKVVQRQDGDFVIQRLRDPDDEFVSFELLDYTFEFVDAISRADEAFVTESEMLAEVVLSAWKAGRDSVVVYYS